ncbi:MAG: HD domain-containing protein [Anaerolineae bacterium]|jgi:uncharacterized protein|nr:HD domain-containing protein [Anaerolineae bacterium]MBT7075881.1 HD domain-containing protein [Anaerolineae bacterium]MBT7783881.1 HD domain-containing protein [Anaerolineae bacterium]
MELRIAEARSWYTESDKVHDFDHVMRVYRMAERLAKAEGADLDIIRAAALLHDSRGSAPGTGSARMEHHQTSAKFAGEVLSEKGWPQEKIKAVQHCILAHRFRNPAEKPKTLEAKIIFDADKLDAIGAIGVARVIGYAAIAGTPFYEKPSDEFLKNGTKTEGESHSAYHEHLYKLRKLPSRMNTSTARKIADKRLLYLDKFFERLIAEWHGEK